MKDNFTSI